MKRFVVILVMICAVAMLIQCGGEKQAEPTTKGVSSTKTTTAKAAESSSGETSGAMSFDLAIGEAIYKKYCYVCHDAGLAGAAKHTDVDRWKESAAKGIPTLIKHVTEGYQGKYGVLPAKGTCMECTDQAIIDVVHYQLKMGGALD